MKVVAIATDRASGPDDLGVIQYVRWHWRAGAYEPDISTCVYTMHVNSDTLWSSTTSIYGNFLQVSK